MTTLARNRKAIDMSWIEGRDVIAGACDKGGVGKTSFIAGFGAALAGGGKKVLVIDANKQGNVSQDLGIPQVLDENDEPVTINDIPVFGDAGAALARAITTGTALEPIPVPDRPNLFLCVGGPEFTKVKRFIASVGENEAPTVLAVSLSQVADQYDYVLIDSPPEDEEMMKVVLGASRWVVCPTKTDDSSLLGLNAVAGVYKMIREDYNPYLELLGSFIFATSMKDDSGPFNEKRAAQQEIMGTEGIACPHGIPFVEKVANLVRAWGKPVTELEAKAIAEGWPLAEVNSIGRVAKAWVRVIFFFQHELQCRRMGHQPGIVERIELDVDDETGNLRGVTPIFAAVGASDEEISA